LKRLLLTAILMFTTSSQACCAGSADMVEVALTASAILVMLCAIILPLVTMLMLKIVSIKSISIVTMVSAIGIVISFVFLIFDISRDYRAGIILLFASSMFFPTGYYCYKAILRHVKSTS